MRRNWIWSRKSIWKLRCEKDRQNCWPRATIRNRWASSAMQHRPTTHKYWKLPKIYSHRTNGWRHTWPNCSAVNAIGCPIQRAMRPAIINKRVGAKFRWVNYECHWFGVIPIISRTKAIIGGSPYFVWSKSARIFTIHHYCARSIEVQPMSHSTMPYYCKCIFVIDTLHIFTEQR